MKKEEEGAGEKKPQRLFNARDGQKWTPYGGNKPFKSKVKELEDHVFELRSVKNATQFS